ncbi:MAG: sigma-70 family RNA polymerase sigma factor [Candidatus Zixiibacteriota bacterium]
MDINKLFEMAINGTKSNEDILFSKLSEIFRMFTRQRVWNDQDCQEIVQDALCVVAQQYRSIKIDVSFSAWAYKILEHKLMNYYRAKKVRESKFAQLQESDGHKSIPEITPELELKLIKCLKEIHNFNQDHLRILNLRYQGFEIKEICKKLGIIPNNVYVSLFRARKMLKECLKKGGIE